MPDQTIGHGIYPRLSFISFRFVTFEPQKWATRNPADKLTNDQKLMV